MARFNIFLNLKDYRKCLQESVEVWKTRDSSGEELLKALCHDFQEFGPKEHREFVTALRKVDPENPFVLLELLDPNARLEGADAIEVLERLLLGLARLLGLGLLVRRPERHLAPRHRHELPFLEVRRAL